MYVYERVRCMIVFFFFNDTATTEIYTLSLHDALPISGVGTRTTAGRAGAARCPHRRPWPIRCPWAWPCWAPSPWTSHRGGQDRKSTRLNSSHANISYAVFCLKKKKQQR